MFVFFKFPAIINSQKTVTRWQDRLPCLRQQRMLFLIIVFDLIQYFAYHAKCCHLIQYHNITLLLQYYISDHIRSAKTNVLQTLIPCRILTKLLLATTLSFHLSILLRFPVIDHEFVKYLDIHD